MTRGDRGTLLAHITDAHVAPHGRATAALKHRSVVVLEDLVAQAVEKNADAVLFGGDNIDNRGHGEDDLEAFLRIVEPLGPRWMAQFGNHEAASGRPGRLDKHAFAKAVAGRGIGPGQHDFSVVVGDVRVIGVDTTLVGSPSGFVTPQTMRFLARELRAAEERHIVVLGHHPIHPAWAPHSLDSWDREYLVANRADVCALLSSTPKVRAYLCGHHHASRIQRVGGRGRSGGFHHVLTASPIAFPHYARWLRFTDASLVISPLLPRIEGLLKEGAEWIMTGRKARRFAALGDERTFLEYLSGDAQDTHIEIPLDGGTPSLRTDTPASRLTDEVFPTLRSH